MINRGTILGDTYYKNVVWNKAVLWKNRQISLSAPIFEKLVEKDIKWIIFKERPSGKPHKFNTKKVFNNNTFKQEGQEPQYYWSIDLES